MNRKIMLWTAVFLFAAVGICWAAAGNVFMGTWTLNEAKSKMTAGADKNSTVTYTMDGDNIKCTIDGTDASGQTIHSEWTGKIDGKEYPVTGNPASNSRSYRMVNAHTLVATEKKDGKLVDTARIVVSTDGKSRTVTVHARDAKGMKTTTVAVYDKQ